MRPSLPMAYRTPVLVIHGGAGQRVLTPARAKIFEASLLRILNHSYARLTQGATAVEAVALAVSLLEDDPLYNAGRGSKIQSDGKIRMSASIMDGEQRRFGGCVNVQRVKNPIFLAQHLLREQDRTLAGPGALKRARELGLKLASPYTPKQRIAFLQKKKGRSGTVGAVALDRYGRLAAATSTGGRGYEYIERVSDSPTVAGNFANSSAAVSATGNGEQIVEFAAAATICAYVEMGWSLPKAVSHLLKKARRQHGDFGLIALDRQGRWLGSTNTQSLLWAARTASLAFRSRRS